MKFELWDELTVKYAAWYTTDQETVLKGYPNGQIGVYYDLPVFRMQADGVALIFRP